MRFGLPFARRARRPGGAHAADANRGVRQPVPSGSSATTSRRTRTASLGIMAAGSGDTASKYVRAPRNAALHSRELHAVHGVHRCVSRHGAAELLAGSRDRASDGRDQLRHRCRRAAEDVPVAAGNRKAHARIDARRGGQERQDAAPGDHSRRDQRRRRVLAGGEERVLRGPRQSAAGVSEDERDFRHAGEEDARRGGVFSIFVSDLCKGCAACVTACGEHQALRMVQETEQVNAEHETGTAFLDLLPDTSQKYLGLYNDTRPQDSKTATLRNMLMVRRNYDALVSGDGACAGCGEKSILKAITSVTEAYMRPLFHAKADRFRAKADELDREGVGEAGGSQGAEPGGVRALPSGRGASADGPWRRGREGHEGTHGRAWSDFGQGSRQRDHGRDAAGGVQSQEPAGHRRPARQRDVGDGHGGAHRLQHRLRLDAVEQPASLSLDELALPGRHHRRLAPRRELHRRSRAPVGDSGTAGRCADASRRERDQRRANSTSTCTSATRS